MVAAPVITYGVWIHGQGWLKKDGDAPVPMRVFATLHKEIASGAAALWGDGARVLPVDDSLIELEEVFVARDRLPAPAVIAKRKWWQR